MMESETRAIWSLPAAVTIRDLPGQLRRPILAWHRTSGDGLVSGDGR